MIAVKILGSGADCQRLEQAARTAVHDSALNATVELVTDPRELARYGLRPTTTAVVVDGRVVVSGRVPSSAELQALLAVAPAP